MILEIVIVARSLRANFTNINLHFCMYEELLLSEGASLA